jgi:hypothetical protein
VCSRVGQVGRWLRWMGIKARKSRRRSRSRVLSEPEPKPASGKKGGGPGGDVREREKFFRKPERMDRRRLPKSKSRGQVNLSSTKESSRSAASESATARPVRARLLYIQADFTSLDCSLHLTLEPCMLRSRRVAFEILIVRVRNVSFFLDPVDTGILGSHTVLQISLHGHVCE